MKTLIPSLVLLASSISAAEVPFCALRFGVAYTDPDRWPEMRAALEKDRVAFDEVWFSTGVTFPKLSWHEEHARQCAAAAADLRKLGIVPSIEIQTVIGHGDAFLVKNDCTGQDWRTWVSADGSVAQRCSCPSDPRLAAYFARVAELHAAWKPGSIWVDDDVTLRNRAPMKNPDKALNGCFCDECIKGFERISRSRESKSKSGMATPENRRAELAAAIRADPEVAARWEAYQCANFAALTKAIAEAVHRVSPETVLGYQFGGTGRAAIAKGLYDGSGIPVRLRPGGAAYWDSDPYQQINKAYGLQELSATFGYPDWIGARCPEIETCPRTFGCRTPQGVILEAFENLALGMDFLSMFVADARGDETTEFYADTLFPRLAAAHPFLKGYRDANVGTKPAGFTVAEGVPNRLVSSRGIPLIDAYGQSLGVLPPVTNIPARTSGAAWLAGGMPKDTLTMQVASSVALTNFYAVCDRACGGRLPALFDRAVMCFVVPRVREDGTLVTLGLVNASIDRQEPVGVRLRGVPVDVTRAFWHTPEDGSVPLAVERRGTDAWVRLPRLGAWGCGYLSFGTDKTVSAPQLIPVPQKMRVTGDWHRVAGSEAFDRSMVTSFKTDKAIAKEGYRLVVTPEAIEVTSSDDAGAFYAVKTLKQLAEPREDALAVPCVEIEDAPRYGWRGVHLDECRHFFGKETVLRTLDLMASYKLNVFHWHLTDQGGWRLEVPGYPKLTEIGAVRATSKQKNESFHSGAANTEKYGPFFYTAADVKEVLAYAAARYITVVPEIEEPAHCEDALRAYPEFSCGGTGGGIFCTGNPATMKFLADVYDYVMDLFATPQNSSNLSNFSNPSNSLYIHIGGDECPMEAWEKCPKCRALREREGLKTAAAQRIWMTERFSEQLAAKGRRAVFWADQKESAYPKGAVVMSWIGASAGIEAAKRGLDVVMAPNGFCYFDYWQGVVDDPFCPRGENLVTPERVYAFDPCDGIPADQRKHILGGQCCNWTEYTYDPSMLEWRLWPRACAMAEVLWTAPAKRDYAAFEKRLAEHVVRLRRVNVNCAPIGTKHVLKAFLDRYVREGRLGGFRTQMGGVTDVGGSWDRIPQTSQTSQTPQTLDSSLLSLEIYGGKLELVDPADEATLYEIRREYRRLAQIVMGM